MTVSAVLIAGAVGFAAVYFGVVEIPGIMPPEWSRFAVPAPAAQPETPLMSHAI
jgi:hypothetical protein